jgi:hypothetical protein
VQVPVATVSPDTKHFDLKSLPGGWVELREMSYGQKLTRQQDTTKMSILMRKGQKDAEGQLATMQTAAAMIDFRTCVVDHNLTDRQEQKLDFKNQAHVSTLSSRVGDEIATYIDQMNNFEEYEDEVTGGKGNSVSASAKLS